jgi:hypothetical protein
VLFLAFKLFTRFNLKNQYYYIQYLLIFLLTRVKSTLAISVAEPHHFYAATAPGKNFDAAPAPAVPAPAPTLLYSKAKLF